MKLNQQDKQLIELATGIAKDNKDLYEKRDMIVACVVLAKSGKIYKGVNIRTSHSICAEQVAIGQAFACGERELDTIVTVKMDKNGSVRPISPCGLCRYTFDKLNLNMNVIVEDVDKDIVLKVKVSDLLPYPYRRVND